MVCVATKPSAKGVYGHAPHDSLEIKEGVLFILCTVNMWSLRYELEVDVSPGKLWRNLAVQGYVGSSVCLLEGGLYHLPLIS